VICARCRREYPEWKFDQTGCICKGCIEVEEHKRCNICRKLFTDRDKDIFTVTKPVQYSAHVSIFDLLPRIPKSTIIRCGFLIMMSFAFCL